MHGKVYGKVLKCSQFAIAFLAIFCFTCFVNATSVIDVIYDLFNLKDIDLNNTGIESSLENGNLQNVYMDYIGADDIKAKISYILLDELNMYIVFDFETAFSIDEYDLTKTYLDGLNVTNEKGECLYKYENSDIITRKNIYQNSNHFKHLIYVVSDNFKISKELQINFNSVKFYSKDYDNRVISTEKIADLEFDYNINVEENNNVIYNYEINTLVNENDEIYIKKALYDETGLNLLIVSKDSNFEIYIDGKINDNKLYIKNKKNDNSYRLYIINDKNFKNKKVYIDVIIKQKESVNKYELKKSTS